MFYPDLWPVQSHSLKIIAFKVNKTGKKCDYGES